MLIMCILNALHYSLTLTYCNSLMEMQECLFQLNKIAIFCHLRLYSPRPIAIFKWDNDDFLALPCIFATSNYGKR